MAFTPTDEQNAITNAAVSETYNLLISARAGAAKTSTLILIAKALPRVNMLCLAFNKKVADELKEKLPPNCTAMTMNSLGHRAWADAIGKKLTLKTTKCYDILSELIERDLSRDERDEVYENMGQLLKACQHAKASGHVPDSLKDRWKNTRLMDDADLMDSLEEIPSPLEQSLIIRVLETSMEQAWAGTIDFADQLLMPTVFRASFPPFNLILADEVQDFSELNHMMLKKLVRRRLIAVGDQAQAIYAFRGAHEKGMEEMQKKFKMVPFPLSMTFRCPAPIVEHIRWRTPDIQSWPDNPNPGAIHYLNEWTLDDIPDDAAIICRNNAPLFSLAIKFLKAGRYPNLWGNDVGKGMISVMKKFGPAKMRQAEAYQALADWVATQEKKTRNRSLLQDRAECIKVFLDACPTLGDAMNYCETVLRSQGRVNLMTGHKSKGAEFDHVYFLDPDLLGDEGQGLNLRYVICTRAKSTLSYLESKGRVG